jgi:hypothetical protein
MTLPLYVWTFLAMVRFAPFEQLPQYPGHTESWREAMARYGEIAHAIATVCETELYPRKCAALLVAIGRGESGFARDADVGPCYRPKHSKLRSRCGGGHAASVWQCEAFGGVTLKQLFADRELAARRILIAANACKGTLNGLAGNCNPSASHKLAARKHLERWRRIEAWVPVL